MGGRSEPAPRLPRRRRAERPQPRAAAPLPQRHPPVQHHGEGRPLLPDRLRLRQRPPGAPLLAGLAEDRRRGDSDEGAGCRPDWAGCLPHGARAVAGGPRPPEAHGLRDLYRWLRGSQFESPETAESAGLGRLPHFNGWVSERGVDAVFRPSARGSDSAAAYCAGFWEAMLRRMPRLPGQQRSR